MSEAVIWEMQFVAVTVTLGIFLSAVYDVIRIFRRIIKHGIIWISVEDILFWTFCGIVIFVVSFWENDGRIRWYTLAGVVFGAYMYHETVSSFIVKFVSFILNTPINIVKKALKKVWQSYRMYSEREGEVEDGKEKKEKSI